MKQIQKHDISDCVNRKDFRSETAVLLRGRYPDRMPLAHVHTYGCQQNVSDSEKMKGMLAELGYGFCDSPQEADLVLYNTCAVRENAEDKVFGNVGQLVHWKRKRPDMLIVLCGCMVQQEHIAEKLKKSYPFVDLVFGPQMLDRLPELLYKVLVDRKRVFDLSQENGAITEGLPVRRDGKVKAWLPIMYGCNNFCTYCVVPYVRGRERSRKSVDILEEAKELIAAGYKEITLLGQNVNSYGKGLEEKIDFAGLLRKLNALDGDFIIRFMTSHPKDATPALIDAMAECEKVCHHLHLPLQSGSDRILKEMNRHYDKKAYRELVSYARQRMPDLSLSSDILVGFPGESKADFMETLSFIEEIKYHFLYTFIYSPRVGTKAAAMPDPVPAAEKSKWFRQLLAVQEGIGQQIYDDMVGSICRVLIEGAGKEGDGTLTGRTEQNVIVELNGPKELIGGFVSVRITQAMRWAVKAELIE